MAEVERSETPGRELAGQALRYGLGGLSLSLAYSAVYWVLAARCGVPVQAANACAFAVNLVAGWFVHSRWSFPGQPEAARAAPAQVRFVTVNFFGYLLNAFWVWLIVDRLGAPVEISILPILTLTPAANFCLTRLWVFGLGRA